MCDTSSSFHLHLDALTNHPTHWMECQLPHGIAVVRGAINERSIQDLEYLEIPPNEIKNKLMKHMHQIAIIYVIILALSKTKLDNKQSPVDPP